MCQEMDNYKIILANREILVFTSSYSCSRLGLAIFYKQDNTSETSTEAIGNNEGGALREK